MKSVSIKPILWILLVINFNALFFLAFQFLWGHSRGPSMDMPVFFHSLWFTIFQGALSAFFCVLVGLIAAPGYARLGSARRVCRWIFLLPNIVSPILAVLSLVIVFKHFQFGLWGIIVGHIFLNGGLAAIWLGEHWLEIERKWGPINEILGGRTNFFFRRGVLPLMKKQIASTFAVVFSLCLVSFAVPLVLGGGPQNSTLEVLIYEGIYTEGDTTSAVFLGLVQCALQFVVFLMILRPTLLKTEYQKVNWQTAQLSVKSLWTLPTLVLAGFCLVPLVQLARMALSHENMSFASNEIWEATLNSLAVASSVASIVFIILGGAGGWGWHKKLIQVPALSGVAVGLAGLLIFKTWTHGSALYLIFALIWGHLAVVCLPVFRISEPGISMLRAKFENTLKQMGASSFYSFKRVYLKLGFKTYLAGAVLAGCWSMGEFSVSTLMSPRAATLPLYIHSLLASYRIEAAAGASLTLLALSVFAMTLFEVLAGGLG